MVVVISIIWTNAGGVLQFPFAGGWLATGSEIADWYRKVNREVR